MVLTHPSIVDGWFREINSQWPGQAMTLKVNRILHVEKSKYQDVLVFESETFGNILVLDGVIQCSERDEFSYQEMIAHIPLASHPNPKKVLVIGGGDGGVVREVLKHNTVEEVVLCDIDEAVIRVSKKYLPHMSSLLADKRVTVYIGDGFAYLQRNTAQFDCIITDSSDPVGPAKALFEKPYFQLLLEALAPGGHISTQGEALWVHLDLISELLASVGSIFPVAEYAFTTIPTYPSGQIGFMLGSKEPGRDLRVPVRQLEGCRYWNQDVHRAAFVLPEFARSMLKEGKDLRPHLGPVLAADAKERKILLLGSGYVAGPAAEYILRDPRNHMTIACRTLASAQDMAEKLPRATGISLDVSSPDLDAQVAAHDVVISLVPYTHHPRVIEAAIKGKTHVVTTSYVSPAMRALDEQAKAAGIVVMNEIGLDPGIDHLYAVKTIDEVHEKGGKIKKFLSYCGGLPAPEASDNPLGYKFSWSSRGVLLALLNTAKYYEDGEAKTVEGKELMGVAKPYYINPAYAFVAYPNRDSTPFREWYNIPEAETVVRGTLRFQGFPAFIKALVEIGFLDDAKKDYIGEGSKLTWAELTAKAVGASSTEESAIINRIKQLTTFPTASEEARILSGLRWIGLFSSELVTPRAENLLDTLCARLEALMAYEQGERDLVMLQHKFFVEWANGKTDIITSTLEAYGERAGYSAMARTVGIPCGIATCLLLDGEPALNKPGVHAPYTKEICDPIRAKLESEGIGMVERVL
ncbi:unnamed protein product [Rhizoctonia solani]|nr:unnamed protein product [Rhizoctonia solani]